MKKAAAAQGQGLAVVHGVAVSGANVAAAPMGFAPPPEVKARQEAQAKEQAAEAKKRELAEAKKAAKAAAKQARRQSDPRLIGLGCEGKYDVGRLLEAATPRKLRKRWKPGGAGNRRAGQSPCGVVECDFGDKRRPIRGRGGGGARRGKSSIRR